MSGGTRTLGIDHVVVVVGDLAAGIAQYERLFGAPTLVAGDAALGYHRAVFALGTTGQAIELCTPIPIGEPGDDAQASRAFRRRLAETGEGVHNVAVAVPDIGNALETARLEGWDVVESRHSPSFFVRPRSASGALLQFLQR